MSNVLGKIKQVPLRKIWKNEARDFTPWVADHLEELNDALGLELEFEEEEKPVGPYSADILTKDTGTGKYVVIENQLEKTDHDHLGKCITYASVLDASAVIWIASKFTDEHKKALDWLNDNTSDNVAFYGVRVELWQIDDSQPAVKFNIINTPNVIVRQARKEYGELTEARKKQLEFWTMFRDKLIDLGQIRSVRAPLPQYWFDVPLGKSGIVLSNTFNTTRNEIGIRIYIASMCVNEWLPYFESKKEEIESEVGKKLNWNPNPNNRDKVITLLKQFNLDVKDNWSAAIDWLANETIKTKKVISRLIKEKS